MGLVERLDFRPHSKQEAQPKQAKDKKGHKKVDRNRSLHRRPFSPL